MKEKIIQILKNSPGMPVSGELLSQQLGVSRAAVSKAVSKLVDSGYQIRSKSRVGYELISSPDLLYSWEVGPYLTTSWVGRELLYFSELDSTNTYAKTISMDGFQNGTVIVAENQTEGRGRRGRAWEDQKGQNLAFSILLKPELPVEHIAQVTLLAAQAVRKALHENCGADVQIKWPNDIVWKGRKLVGILTEMGSQEGTIDYLVVGIGVNVNPPKEAFEKPLRAVATSLREICGHELDRKFVLASILNYFEQLYETFLTKKSISFFREDYCSHCVNVGRELVYEMDGVAHRGVGEGVDAQGRLLVRMPDKTTQAVLHGEVSVKGIYGTHLPDRP